MTIIEDWIPNFVIKLIEVIGRDVLDSRRQRDMAIKYEECEL